MPRYVSFSVSGVRIVTFFVTFTKRRDTGGLRAKYFDLFNLSELSEGLENGDNINFSRTKGEGINLRIMKRCMTCYTCSSKLFDFTN